MYSTLNYSTFKTSAKVCRAEAWTFVCREQSSKLYKRSTFCKTVITLYKNKISYKKLYDFTIDIILLIFFLSLKFNFLNIQISFVN